MVCLMHKTDNLSPPEADTGQVTPYNQSNTFSFFFTFFFFLTESGQETSRKSARLEK